MDAARAASVVVLIEVGQSTDVKDRLKLGPYAALMTQLAGRDLVHQLRWKLYWRARPPTGII